MCVPALAPCYNGYVKITPALFEAFLKCRTKCWLRSQGETDGGNEYANWVESQNESYRIEAAKRLAADSPPDDCAIITPQPEILKSAQWRLSEGLSPSLPPAVDRFFLLDNLFSYAPKQFKVVTPAEESRLNAWSK